MSEQYKFDYAGLDYATFEFNNPTFECDQLHDICVDDVYGYPNLSNFSDIMLKATKQQVENDGRGYENITVQKGDCEPGRLGVDVLSDGKMLGTAYIDISVDYDYLMDDQRENGVTDPQIPKLPNGDLATDMEKYTWEDFEKLEQIAQNEQETDFAAAVDNISESENALARG